MKKALFVLVLLCSFGFGQEADTTAKETATISPLYSFASSSLEYVKGVSTTTRYTFTYGAENGLGEGVEWVFADWQPAKYANIDVAIGALVDPLQVEISGNYSPTTKPIDLKIVSTHIGAGIYGSIDMDGELDYGAKINLDANKILGFDCSEIIGKVFFFLPGKE